MSGVTESVDWRARKRDETHQRIYQNAMRLFHERGFENVSVSQIASASGVSVPTFYAHYASKEQIVIHLAPENMIAAALADQPEDLPLGERIRRATPQFLANFGPEARADMLTPHKETYVSVGPMFSFSGRSKEAERELGLGVEATLNYIDAWEMAEELNKPEYSPELLTILIQETAHETSKA